MNLTRARHLFSQVILRPGTVFGALLLLTACSTPSETEAIGNTASGEAKDGVVEQGPANELGTSRQRLEVNEWPLEALVATNSIRFEDRVKFTGNIAVRNAVPGPVLANNAEVSLGSDAKLTGNVRADTLYLGDRAVVTGSAAYNSVQNNGTIQGSSTSPLGMPLAITIPTFPSVTIGTQDHTLTHNQQLQLNAGRYGGITLRNGNGGGVTRLTLSGGLYELRSLTLENDARVECAAPCEIRVRDRASIGDRSHVRPKPGVAGLGSGNVQLLVRGTNGGSGPAGQPAAVQTGQDSQLHAYVFGPNGTVRLGHRVVLTGKIVARDVLVGFDIQGEGQQLALITTHPSDVEVRETDIATFSVQATGEGLSYQWQKNGVNVPGATAASYTTPPTVAADTNSRFRVVITSAAGTVISNEATLTVIPCTDLDLTCDDFDDDCDGARDEDFAQCEAGGNGLEICVNGQIVLTTCNDDNLCNGVEVCSAGACMAGALAPVGTDCSDGDAAVCDGMGSCLPVDHDGAGPDLGPVVGGTPEQQCSQADNKLQLSGWNSAVQGWTTVVSTPGGSSCPTPVLANDVECTDLVTLAELQAELVDPNAPHGPCSELDPGGITDCPIDPETVRVVACQGVDGLCNESIGERCLSRCITTSVVGEITNSNCQNTEWVCARTVEGCEAPLVLAEDARGCLPDVWDCSEPGPDTGSIDGAEVAEQLGSKDGSDSITVDESRVKHTVPGYASLSQVHECQPRPLADFGDETGILQEDAKEANEARPIEDKKGQGLFGDPLILGGDKFGLYAQPTLYHEFGLDVQHLDHLELTADAQGALIAGVKVFGFDVTVLDVDARVTATQCGVRAGARFDVFGETVVGIPAEDSVDPECGNFFNALIERAAALREAAILARKLRQRYDEDPASVCEYMATVWGRVEVPWECSSLGELEGVPQNEVGWGTVLTDAAITYYHSKVQEYLALRQQYVALASATARSVGEPSANAELLKTPFVSTTQEANIPIGPITLTLATSLSGSYGLKGGVFYTLDHGFDAAGITTGNPEARGGVVVTPGLSVDGALYVGVGFGFGAIASASVGVEGQLTFLDVSVPIHAGVGVSGRSFGDAEVGRDVANSDWAGLPTGIPSDRVFSWELDWDFGARLKLQTLSGKLNAAARVRFLFYSKTFRKKLTEWEGPFVAFSLAETQPVNDNFDSGSELQPFGAEGVNMGWQADPVGYRRVAELDGAWTFSESGAEGICTPQFVVR